MIKICEKAKTESDNHKLSEESLKDRVFRWLSKHMHEQKRGKIIKLATDLGLDYKNARGYLYQLSSQFKTYPINGRHPNGPGSQHNWVAVGFVGFCLDRKRFPAIEDSAVELGWILSRNRNRELIWVDKSLGRVRWWATGKVLILVRQPGTLGRAKQLAARAFIWNHLILYPDDGFKFVNGVRWHSSEDVFLNPEGKRLPYMRINAYKDIFGEIVLGDSSHPDGIEIKVCPELLHKHYESLGASTEAIKENLSVIKEIQDVLKQFNATISQLGKLLQRFSMPLYPKNDKDKTMVV